MGNSKLAENAKGCGNLRQREPSSNADSKVG